MYLGLSDGFEDRCVGFPRGLAEKQSGKKFVNDISILSDEYNFIQINQEVAKLPKK